MKKQLFRWQNKKKNTRHHSLNTASDKAGMAPGTLVHVGESYPDIEKITLIQYSREQLKSNDIDSIEELPGLLQENVIQWINIDGLANVSNIEFIGQLFNIDALVQEDILHTNQRPKLVEREHYLYLVFNCINFTPHRNTIFDYQQVSILLLPNCVVTFNEDIDKRYDSIYRRLRKSNSRFRRSSADYLVCALLDAFIDEYFNVEDYLEDKLILLEDELYENNSDTTLQLAHILRRQLIELRRKISPLSELLYRIHHADNELIIPENRDYFEDTHEHVLRLLDTFNAYSEQIIVMQDIHLSRLSHKMNETMRVLTVFASIFIPLTFIAGIYGMNFEYMPELKWRWSYPFLWVVFIFITATLIIYFKKKKWL